MNALGKALAAASFALLTFSGQAFGATTVPGNTSSLVDLGSFAAGTYQLTGSGVIDLCGNGTFPMNPDGTPAPTVTCSNYGTTFNPNGAFTADGSFGPAGSVAKIGSLIGTLNQFAFLGNNPNPTQQADWFLIGFGTQVTLNSAAHIYAFVNDTFASNNTGSFEVLVSEQRDVPAPQALSLIVIALGAAVWRRRGVR